jgi:hypothetical protein
MERITGLVVTIASGSGSPVEGVRIEVRDTRPHAERALTRTDACGRAMTDGLEPGLCQLLVWPPTARHRAEHRVVHLEPGRNVVTLQLREVAWPLWQEAL